MTHKLECDAKWAYDQDHCICRWIEAAEQRIIKLLEDNLVLLVNGVTPFGKAIGWQDRTKREPLDVIDLLALIKGENK